MDDYPDAPDVDETGMSFLANAVLKARSAALATGHWALGEDSGLCVDALGGQPGIYSARYSGEPSDDERNNDKLLAALADVPDDERTAHYTCVAAVCDPTGEVSATSEGRCEGVIVRARRGAGGFGYDPLFLVPSEAKTFGELPASFKQQISHRSSAILSLRPQLASLIASGVWALEPRDERFRSS
jgi:XTP/dITP diphosphohydrolase